MAQPDRSRRLDDRPALLQLRPRSGLEGRGERERGRGAPRMAALSAPGSVKLPVASCAPAAASRRAAGAAGSRTRARTGRPARMSAAATAPP